jgi:hypothetical protein
VERIDLAQGTHRWRAHVHAVTNLGLHRMRGISRLAVELSAFQEGSYSMKLVS